MLGTSSRSHVLETSRSKLTKFPEFGSAVDKLQLVDGVAKVHTGTRDWRVSQLAHEPTRRRAGAAQR